MSFSLFLESGGKEYKVKHELRIIKTDSTTRVEIVDNLPGFTGSA